MIFRRFRRILAAENADYTSIAYFPALFKSEFGRNPKAITNIHKKAAQSENRTAFLKNLWCGRQDLNLHAEAIEPKSIVSASFTTSARNAFSIPRFSGFVKHVHQFFRNDTPKTDKPARQMDKKPAKLRVFYLVWCNRSRQTNRDKTRQTGSKLSFSEEAIMKMDFRV